MVRRAYARYTACCEEGYKAVGYMSEHQQVVHISGIYTPTI